MHPAIRDRLLLLAVVAALGSATAWAASFVIEPEERGHQLASDLFLRIDPGRAALFNQADFADDQGPTPTFRTPGFPAPPLGSVFYVFRLPGLGGRDTLEYQSALCADGQVNWSLDVAIPWVLRAHVYRLPDRFPWRNGSTTWSVGGSLLIPTALLSAAAGCLARRRARAVGPHPDVPEVGPQA